MTTNRLLKLPSALFISLLCALSFTHLNAATLVADYRLEGNLKSSVAGAPDVQLEGVPYAKFVTTDELGTSRPILDVGSGGGLSLDSTGLVDADHYSAVLLVSLNNVAGYSRLFDPKNASSAAGWMMLNGAMIFYPTKTDTAPSAQSGQFVQLTFVKDGDNVRAYADGVKQFDIPDPDEAGQIGESGVLRFLRQGDGQYATGGRMARIRLYQGALADTEVAALTKIAPLTPLAPSGAAIAADYRFESSLKSSVKGAPDLVFEGSSFASFVPDTVFGTNRTVLDFANGGGVSVDTTGLVNRDSYTVVALFEMENTAGYNRIFAARADADTQGLFFLNGELEFNPLITSDAPPIPSRQYTQVVLVDNGLSVRAYRDGLKALDLIDAQDLGSIGTNGILHVMRQGDGNYAPGGRLARLRIFNGGLNDTEVQALDLLAPATPPPASGATAVADYRFESSLKSSIAGAPDLVFEGATFGSFLSDNVFGTNRTVFGFGNGGGVRLNTTGLINRDSYTLVALFEMEGTGGYNRIFDSRDNPDTQGLFFLNGDLLLNPYRGSDAPPVAPHQYTQVALVDNGLSVKAYRDGTKVLDLVDMQDYYAIGTNGIIHFMRQADGNYAPGARLARVRVFNGALTESEIAKLDLVVPITNPAPSGGRLVADYQFQNNFDSSVGTVPPIEPTSTDAIAFVDAPELGGRRVLKFNPSQGLRLAASGFVDTNHFTVVVGFSFDSVGGYNRLLDTKDPSETMGWFILNGTLGFQPFSFTPWQVVLPGEFSELALVYDGGFARAFADGVKQIELLDLQHSGAIGTNGMLSFFRNADGNYAPGGRVTRIRIYDGALTDSEVFAVPPSVPRHDLSVIPPGSNVALRFNGNYLTVPNTNTLKAPYTVEFWALPSGSGGTMGVIGSRQPSENGFDVKFTGTSGVHGDIGTGAGWLTTGADYQFPSPVTNWVHIAYVLQPDSYQIVVNGQLAASNTLSGGDLPLLYDASHQLRIGNSYGSEYMDGQLDEIRIWNVARTPAQIAADYRLILRGDEIGLVNYYRFSEGHGSTMADLAPAGGLNPATSDGSIARWVLTGPDLDNIGETDQSDLVLRSVKGPATVIPGQPANITYTIANEGATTLRGPWTDAVFLSRDATPGLNFFVDSFVVTNTLSPGSTLTLTQQVIVPANGPNGRLFFVVGVDAGNAFNESNETNNILADPAGVTVSALLSIDLATSQVREDVPTVGAVVTRNGDLSAPLTVTLQSGDLTEAKVPASILIPAGQASANFLVQVLHDGQLDGPQTLTLSAQAPGFQTATAPLTVLDSDLPALTLAFDPVRVMEGAASTATVTRQGDPSAALPVNFAGPLGQLTFPSQFTIPAGQSSISFAVRSIDDSFAQSTSSNLFTASAEGFVSGSARLVVDDNDIPKLRITLASHIVSESAGVQAVSGTITRDKATPRPLTISLMSGNPSAAQVPTTVIIPAGSTNGVFNVSVTDNSIVDGTRDVVIGAILVDPNTRETLAEALPDILTITDDDGPSLKLVLGLSVVGEGVSPATTGTITRNTSTNAPLSVSLSSSATAHATVPSTVTIPAGAASVTFPIASVADAVQSGNQPVVITASANGFAPAAQTLVVTDADLPDLTVTSLRTPASAISESSFNVTFRIENHGLSPSGTNFVQQILLSTDQLPSSDDQILFENTLGVSIPAGLFVEQTFQMRAPKTPGDFYLIVVTDADNQVAEILENNNNRVSSPFHIEKAYHATVATDVTVAAPNSPIPLHGKASLTLNNAPAPFVPVDLTVRVRGTERHLAALTDLSGNYNAVFQPLPGEAGSYTVAADYPGTTNSPAQASFALLGLSIDHIPGEVKVAEGTTGNFMTQIHNLANLPLTQLQVAVLTNPPGVTIDSSLSSASLAGDGDATLSLTLKSAAESRSGNATVRVTSSEGASADLSIPILIELARPRLVATPESLEAGMRRGGQTTVEIGITNSGGRATGLLNVLAPAASWLKVASGTQIPALAPGEGTTISLLLTPSADLDLGPYTGSIVVNSTNASLSIPFTFRNLSDSTGSLLVQTVDEYTYYAAGSPKLTNALVRLIDSTTKEVVSTNVTGSDGTLFFPNLQEAYYDLEISADGHSSYKSTLLVEAAKTNRVTALLSRQTVRYVFSVVPTEIEDRTKIEITTVFETFVPIPVLTADPVYFDLSGWSGSVTQVNITLMNHGLLAAQNVRFALPEDPNIEFTSLVSQIGTLPAQSSITVPVIIRKRDAASFNVKSAEKTIKAASSAGGCYHDASFDFDLVCGPQVNTYNVPVRFDKLPGCPNPPGLTSYFEPFNYAGNSGPGGGYGGFGTCPDCYAGGPPVIFAPPRETVPPHNCNPCIEGAGLAAACYVGIPAAGARDAAVCAMAVAGCGAGLASGVNLESALGCLSAAGSCAKTTSVPLQIPACLLPLKQCLSAGGKGTSVRRRTAQTAGSIQNEADLPQELQPLVRQLDRVIAVIAPITNLFGSDAWFQGVDEVHWSNWFSSFEASIDVNSASGVQIAQAELDSLLGLPAPTIGLTANDVKLFAARWNRTVDYYRRGIFTDSQVPAGESPDFVAIDTAADLARAAIAANEAAIADGFSDAFSGAYQASQEFIGKANSAGGGSCATVKLKIEQEAVITRDAFNATLEIANDTDQPLTDISVELNFHSATGEDTSSLFAVQPPALQGLSGVNGTGQIAAKSTGKASWILIPTSDAAPSGPVTHVVGGTLRYQQDGVLIVIPLIPGSINVLPNASLSLKYFHQRDVFADDPFTDEIEPSIPYSLAVMIQNSGKGTARNLRITSAQPKIVDNQKGLLIDFNIIATEVAGQSLTPSLTANFGDILPGEIKIGRWLLKSSLQGLFTDYSASFENLDGLGDKRLSLIQNVEIHEMEHIVQADRTFEDGQPDFLANDVPDFNDYPDTLHFSQGTTAPVLIVTNSTVDAPVSLDHLRVSLSASMPAGWGYLRAPDPSNGKFRLIEVRRADNSIVALETNVWTTDRTFIGFSQKPVRENVLHLLDYQGTGAYSLLYAPVGPVDTTAPSSRVAALSAQVGESIPVSWSGDDGADGSGIAYYDIYVSVNGGTFTPWLRKATGTGALYPGQIGNSYAFYSIATDFAGNQQTIPSQADAQTTVNVVNTPPQLNVASAQSVDEGALLTFSNTAIDNDIPSQTLTWSLGNDAPAGAQINPSSGVVNWLTSEATGPSTNTLTIIVRDNGQPFLAATGVVSVIVREVNSAPTLGATTNRVVNELQTIRFQALATDADLPANGLTFSLIAPPQGASMSPSGFFTWTPSRLQGPSTNLIQFKVTDNGVPPMSATQSFTVVVRDSEGDFDLKADNLVAQLAPELSSTLSINSGLDLSSISFDLNANSDRLENVSIEPLIPELASATLTPASATSFNVHLVAGNGELLQGNRPIANLTFNAGTNLHSEIITLLPRNITATRSSGAAVPQANGIPGRLILIGLEPVLEASKGTPVSLKLYGIPNHNYTLEQKPDITPAVPWKPILQYTQTNLFQGLQIVTNTPVMFYRTHEN